MRQEVKIVLGVLWLLGSLPPLPATGAEPGAHGSWVLATDALGPVRWLEVEISDAGPGLRATTAGFAAVGMEGFDALLFEDLEWRTLVVEGSRLRGRFDLRGRTVALDLVTQGELARGTVLVGKESQAISGRRLDPLSAEDLARFVGVYDAVAADEPSLVVTWREYGGLRAVNLETGQGFILDPVSRNRFATRRSLAGVGASPEEMEFDRDEKGVHLVWNPSGENTVRYARRPGFDQERIAFESGGSTLRGTLFRPPVPEPVPAVVLVHGSGAIYRTALADRAVRFTELGGAAFVYDKRGTGRSEGSWRDASFQNLAADARAALRKVGGLPGIDPTRLGFQGHSQAGWIIPVAAAGQPEVAFAIVVSGGPITPGEQTLFDKENDLRRQGFELDVIEGALSLLRRVHTYVKDREGDYTSLNVDYLAAQKKPWFPVLDLPRLESFPSWEDPSKLLLAAREELAFDSGPFVERMERIPVLVLLGAADETVPAERTAAAWRARFPGAGSDLLRIEIVPDADHGFRSASATEATGRVSAYDAIQREWWHRHVSTVPGEVVEEFGPR